VAKIGVLLAEDHAVVREGFRSLLDYQAEFKVVGAAANGAEAIQLYLSLRPDVVLMDLQLPELDGVEATKQIRDADPNARVVILTTYEGDEDVRSSIAAGAMGYLLKECPPEELFRAIRTVVGGEPYFCDSAKTSMSQHASEGSLLSRRELEVLTLVARGLSNREVAEALFLSEATARTHVAHILSKLDVTDRLAAVMAAVRLGILRV
jgi:DNA-binding NarL/FixJ family response regulator